MGLLAKANAVLGQERNAAIEAAEAAALQAAIADISAQHTKEKPVSHRTAQKEVVQIDGTVVTPTKWPSVMKSSGIVKRSLPKQPAKEPRIEFSQDEAQAVAWAASSVSDNREQVKQGRFKKLKRLITAFAVGLTVAQTPLLNRGCPVPSNQPSKLEVNMDLQAMQKTIDQFASNLGGVNNYERNVMAKMLYGEAGLGTDPFEVLHTVLNRMASPLFKGGVEEIIKQPGQYLGYSDENPVTPAYRRMVDLVVDEWEANGKQAVTGCNHYYFVTGVANVCNKFEISRDNQGKWVAPRHKQYEKLRHYCPVAQQQAANYYQKYGHSNARSL